MELQQINQRIAVVNGESKRLNSERQVLIGRRQTLDKQLSEAIAAYQREYGVDLSVGNIDAEIARVAALKDAEVSGIETMLSLIKSGKYEEAERLAQGPAETQVEAQAVGAAVPAQDTQEQQDVVGDVPDPAPEPVPDPAPVPQAPPVVPSAPPAAQPAPAQVEPPAPSAPPVTQIPGMPPTFQKPPEPPAPAAPPVPPQPPKAAPVAPKSVQQDDAPPAPPPPIKAKPKQPLGAPKIGVPPQMGTTQPGGLSFQAILSGEAFNPQNGG